MKKRVSVLTLAGAVLLSLAACIPEEAAVSPTPTPMSTPEMLTPEVLTPVPVQPEAIVIDRYRVEYDQPEDYRLDITIPMLREELRGAADINGQISADYGFYLNTPPEDFLKEGDCLNFDYSFVHIWYETYAFGQLYELVVRYEEYSLYGSGLYSWNTIYCYDAETGVSLSISDFLDRIGISQADVLSTGQALEEGEGEYESFDALIHFFYIDGDKNVIIEPNT